MRYHDKFEWDPKKAKANEKNHRVSFDDAAAALGDEQADRFHYEEYDDAHSMEEDRHTTFASDPFDRNIILRITWTDRSTKDKQVTHIISARIATSKERKLYEKAIFKGK